MKTIYGLSGKAGQVVFLFALFAALTVPGCSVHKPGVREVKAVLPGSFSDGGGEGPLIGKWWERFEDDKLELLMNKAFQRNLDIAGSFERFQQALAVVDVTGASGGPVLGLDGSGGRARQSGEFGAVTSGSYSLSAAASYELDFWRRISSSKNAAELKALATRRDLEVMYLTISARLADLYFLAAEQRAQIDLADRTIASYRETFESVKRRYLGGLVPAVDVYQAEQGLMAAMSRRPSFESRLHTAVNELSVIAGNFPGKETGGIKELKDITLLDPGLPSQLLERRPDIKAAFLRLEASDREVAGAVSDRFPSVKLTGNYGGMDEKLAEVLDSPNIFWNVLLQVSQPILDAGKRKAEVRRAEAVFRENLALYHKTVLNAFREVEDSLSKIESSKERIRALEKSVSSSGNSLRLALESYMKGLTGYLPVLSQQQRHYEAESGLLAARRQLISDRIQLVRSIGGDWMDEVINRNMRAESKGVENR